MEICVGKIAGLHTKSVVISISFGIEFPHVFPGGLPEKFPQKSLTFGKGEDKMKMVFY
jgi:hypothetical protein